MRKVDIWGVGRGWLILAAVLGAALAAACSSGSDDPVGDLEAQANLFEHRCEPVSDAYFELLEDEVELHELRSGRGSEASRQLVDDLEQCVEMFADIVRFIEDNEEGLVSELGSDEYTDGLEGAEEAVAELQELVRDVGPYPTETERLAAQERLQEQAAAQQERAAAQAAAAQQELAAQAAQDACPRNLRYAVQLDASRMRAWAVGEVQEDGSLRIWVNASSGPAAHDPCLEVDGTARLVSKPEPGVWYRSGTVSLSSAEAELATRGRINADGSLQLELIGTNQIVEESTTGRVPAPEPGVIYRATSKGQTLNPCSDHLRYLTQSSNGLAWAVAELQDDGSVRFWVAIATSTRAPYDRCLVVEDSRRVVPAPKPGQWYSSGAVGAAARIAAQVMLDESGALRLRLKTENNYFTTNTVGMIEEPRPGVAYRHSRDGGRITLRR